MKKILLIMATLMFYANLCYAYTDNEKRTIYNYIEKQINSNSANEAIVVLFYYLDHKDEIDVNKIIDQNKQDKITSLQKTIDDATQQLNVLQTPVKVEAP